MKRIQKIVDEIDDELCSAKEYAECYVDKKAHNESSWANKFKEMSQDELKHAMYLHDYAVQEIDILNKVYTPPTEMMDAWEECHEEYVEKAAWIKQMLTL